MSENIMYLQKALDMFPISDFVWEREEKGREGE